MAGQLERRIIVLERLVLGLQIEKESVKRKIRRSAQNLQVYRNRGIKYDYTPSGPVDCTYWGPLKFTVYWAFAQGPYFEHTLPQDSAGASVQVGNEQYSMVRNFDAYGLSYRKFQNPSDITFRWGITHSQSGSNCGEGFSYDFGFNSAGSQVPSGSGDAYRLTIESV